jgi:hypothetical protein
VEFQKFCVFPICLTKKITYTIFLDCANQEQSE